MAQFVFLVILVLLTPVLAVILARLTSPTRRLTNAALSGEAIGPFAVLQGVRRALLAGQLDSIRNLLSDPLYQRLKASPPPVREASRPVLATRRQVDSDPDRVVLMLSGGTTVSGAETEEWTMLHVSPDESQGVTSVTGIPAPAPGARGWIVDDIRPAGPMTR